MCKEDVRTSERTQRQGASGGRRWRLKVAEYLKVTGQVRWSFPQRPADDTTCRERPGAFGVPWPMSDRSDAG